MQCKKFMNNTKISIFSLTSFYCIPKNPSQINQGICRYFEMPKKSFDMNANTSYNCRF